MALREQVDIWAMPQSPTAFGGALRARAPLSLRDISPHCGESPFTQGSLLLYNKKVPEPSGPGIFYCSNLSTICNPSSLNSTPPGVSVTAAVR